MLMTLETISGAVPLVMALWPGRTQDEAMSILREYADSDESCVIAAENGKDLYGVAMCALRHDYVEGCDTSPVGYLEGIYVSESHRHVGVARAMLAECEDWARSRGCTEFASDCELTNEASWHFHLSMGFAEKNRIICFKKMLK